MRIYLRAHKSFLAIFISTSLICSSTSEFERVQKKWENWANLCVEKTKTEVLNFYRVNICKLTELSNDQAFVKQLKSSHDHLVRNELASSNSNTSENMQKIYELALSIFKGHKIKIINDTTLPSNGLGVMQVYEENMCYICLNAHYHIDNLDRLDELLRHEHSHIYYEDNFHRELLEALMWTNSNDSFEQTSQNCAAFGRACELRADIHAAITSPSHGKQLIAFLKIEPETADLVTHPRNQVRIELLEKIRLELDSAKKKN